jgi:hypothetical protein
MINSLLCGVICGQTSAKARRKAVKAKVDEVSSSNARPSKDLRNATAFAKKENAARIGWAVTDLVDNEKLVIAFGRWNDRAVNTSQANKLADGFRDGLKRFWAAHEIKVPVSLNDFTEGGRVRLVQTRKLSTSDLMDYAPQGKLPRLESLLKETTQRIHPAGGQHRQRALKIYLKKCQKELDELAQQLVDWDGE